MSGSLLDPLQMSVRMRYAFLKACLSYTFTIYTQNPPENAKKCC